LSGLKLFLCGTPLHSLMAKRIIEHENIDKDECVLFFYSRVMNKKYEYYFSQISTLFSESIYFYSDSRYPRYLIEARKILEEIEYDSLYFGNACVPYVLLALSAGKHKEVVTFDDGVQNIFAGSPFASKYGMSLKKYLGMLPFGNKYSLQKIRNETSRHYTIYPGFKNYLSENPTPLSIFPVVESSEGGEICSIILGTNFKNAFPSQDLNKAYRMLSEFSDTLEGDVYYLAHPRASGEIIRGCCNVETEKIAEEFVGEMYAKYRRINLYGFCSSAQLNLAHLPNVYNYFISIPLFEDWIEDVVAMMSGAGVPVEDTVSIKWR
jgi:beta-galactosamide-alpha-2,3-sialyltransferase